MALQGKFVVNEAKFSPLTISGLGTFLAFSGNKQFRNKGGCVGMPDNGPLPPSKYWIVERQKGGLRTWLQNKAKEIPTWFTSTPTHYDKWFARYRDDGRIEITRG